MGGVDAAQRIRDGEPFDIAVLAADAMQKLESENHILPGSRDRLCAFGNSDGGRSGSPHPRLNDEHDVKNAILAARADRLFDRPQRRSFDQVDAEDGA